jgi:hypothetical protein
MASSATVETMCCWVSVFSALAAVVFFGWGFDGCRAAAAKTWVVLVVLTVVFVVWEAVAANFYLVPLNVGLM